MKRLLLLLLEVLSNLFRWRAQVTDPLAEYRKAHGEWEVALKRLEGIRNEARAKYINHCLVHKHDDGQLLFAWIKAAKDISSHYAREPQRENYRAE